MRRRFLLSGVIGLVMIGGCKEETGVDGLVDFVGSTQLGENPAYWFELLNVLGDWEKTMLIFGYWNNEVACNFQLELARKDPQGREYRCLSAN